MYIIKLRRGTSSEWTAKNPKLRDGEPGFETDTRRLKIGNGLSLWNNLPYVSTVSDGSTPVTLEEHIIDPTPHTAYDDGPSFELLYQNAKV